MLQHTQQEFRVSPLSLWYTPLEVGVYTPCHCGVPVGIQAVPSVTVGFPWELELYLVSLWNSFSCRLSSSSTPPPTTTNPGRYLRR